MHEALNLAFQWGRSTHKSKGQDSLFKLSFMFRRGFTCVNICLTFLECQALFSWVEFWEFSDNTLQCVEEIGTWVGIGMRWQPCSTSPACWIVYISPCTSHSNLSWTWTDPNSSETGKTCYYTCPPVKKSFTLLRKIGLNQFPYAKMGPIDFTCHPPTFQLTIQIPPTTCLNSLHVCVISSFCTYSVIMPSLGLWDFLK